MDSILNLLAKLIGNKLNSGKNYLIMLLVLFVISLNLLGFDIAKISDTPYIIIILFLLNYIINILTDTYTINKLNDIETDIEKNSNTYDLIENNIEKSDLIIAVIHELKINNDDIILQLKEIYSEISGKPNIPNIKIITTADTKSLVSDLFNECLNYTLMCNEQNLIIANENLKVNLDEYINDYINIMHKTLILYDSKETLSKKIKDKLSNLIIIVLNDIQTNKSTNEKLYIISVILRNIKNEIIQDISDYLRNIQTNKSID